MIFRKWPFERLSRLEMSGCEAWLVIQAYHPERRDLSIPQRSRPAVLSVSTAAQATEYCIIGMNGKVINFFKTESLCENRASRMRGWVCEER